MKVEELLEAIALTLEEVIKAQLASFNLADSRIIKSVSTRVNGYTIELYMPDYWKYIEAGRLPGKWVPVAPLIQWLRRKGVSGNLNRIAYAVSNAIKRRGVRARPFLKNSVNIVEKEVAEVIGLDFSTILDQKILEALNGKS